MEEKSREIAKKLLKLGTMSEEEILQVTEISKEQLCSTKIILKTCIDFAIIVRFIIKQQMAE